MCNPRDAVILRAMVAPVGDELRHDEQTATRRDRASQRVALQRREADADARLGRDVPAVAADRRWRLAPTLVELLEDAFEDRARLCARDEQLAVDHPRGHAVRADRERLLRRRTHAVGVRVAPQHALCARARVCAEFQAGSASTGGFEWLRP